jgi:DNA polymerase-3 subunit beta
MTKSNKTSKTTEITPKTALLSGNFAKALSTAGKAVANKSTLPVLGNILLKTDSDARLQVTGTNLEIALTAYCGARNTGEWSLTLPAKTLTDIVALLPDDAVELEYQTRTASLVIRSGTFVTTLKGLTAEEFPLIPAVGTEGFFLLAELLADALRSVLFATGDDDRPILAGVLITAANNTLTFVAADGFRLAEYTLRVPVGLPEFKIIVPAVACAALIKQLNSDETAHVVIFKNDGKPNRLGVRCGSTEFVAQLIEGEYPDYTNIVPQESTLQTQFSVADLRQTCKAADIIARDNAHTLRLTVHPEPRSVSKGQRDGAKAGPLPAGLSLISKSAELGEHRSFVPATVEGPQLDIAFNAKYLLDGLNAIATEQAVLALNTPTTPGVLRPVGADNYQVVLMPMTVGK